MSATITEGFLDHRIFRIVSDAAEELGVRAFVIGGYVRDCFLGRPSKDIDIVVEGSGIFACRGSGGKGAQSCFGIQEFRNCHVAFPGCRG